MGSLLSTTLYQPFLLLLATTLMITALMYKGEKCDTFSHRSEEMSSSQGNSSSITSRMFKINMILSAIIMCVVVLLMFFNPSSSSIESPEL
jgi:hypothetical protein